MKINSAKTRDRERCWVDYRKARSSAYTDDFKGEYYYLRITKLIPFKYQVRLSFDKKSLRDLAKTIDEYGVRQPLTVIPSEERTGYYEIISGERRFRAAKLLNLFTLPCIIIYDKKRSKEIALIENLQRKNLHPLARKVTLCNWVQHSCRKNFRYVCASWPTAL